MVEEYHNGANVLLAYFHYCSKGILPFAMNSKTAELTTMGRLNQKQVSLVENTKKYVKAHSEFIILLNQPISYIKLQKFASRIFGGRSV
jgi:hypothetical protein